MKAFCNFCHKTIDYLVTVTHTEQMTIKGISFSAEQRYGVCPICNGEVLTNQLVDLNVHLAHSAYRRAIGSITSEEIASILEKYDIGAQPLSRLLGWGQNTIERQMKHTVPDRAHSDILRLLNDPNVMLSFLVNNRGSITSLAYNKAIKATLSYLSPGLEGLSHNSAGAMFKRLSLMRENERSSGVHGSYQEEYSSKTGNDIFALVYNH